MSKTSPLRDRTDASGATYTDECGWSMPQHYGDVLAEYHAALTAAALFDVSHRGKLQVAGRDAPTFLHNLCTNDIVNLPLGAGCEAFFCNPKAKVIAHVLIYHIRIGPEEHAFWIDTPPGDNDKLRAHLHRYIIAEEVEVTDRTSEFCQVHLAGPQATAVLSRALADIVPDLQPLMHMERTFGTNVTAHIRRHDPLNVPGFDIVCRNALASGLWRVLTEAGAQPAGLESYEMLRIEAGTPVYSKDITEERFAFDVGRTAQAICYTKGCYLGQEPIVMARDRAGHAPRTLMGLILDEPVPPGSAIIRDGQEIGHVTSSTVSPRLQRAVALGYVRHGHHHPGISVEVRTPTGSRGALLQTLPLVPSGASEPDPRA
jgi:folate-binding protein YgfZ